MPSIIHTLTPISSPSTCEPGPSLRDQIETGLLGTTEPTIPGSTEEDKKWAYTKSVPTLVLYDEQGLRLYDKITSDAPEYYLFADELNLLKTHGKDIARAMGFPGKDAPEYDSPERNQSNEEPPTRRWRQARWGDMEVGKWNQGVNGEQGIAGGVNRGYDVVELGAGALRKTGHLLSALAASVPDSDSAPITYHPLDLSYPELDRVLGEMDEAFGQELQGKVQCIGLHGDYEAGLQMIREGNLPSLRQMIPEQPRGRLSERAGKTGKRRDSSLSPVSDSQLVTPAFESKILEEEPSPSYSMASDMAVLPDHELSSLPSAITETDGSSTLSKDKSGTWSPVSNGEATGVSISVPDEFDTKGLQLALPPMKHTTSPTQELPARPLHLVFLGSSLGNFSRDSAAPFLKSLPLRHGDTLLLGLDGRPTPGHEGNRKVEIAYNDPAGHTRAFEEHGWEIVREELGLEGDAGVEFVGRYNEELGRHEAYFRSKAQQTLHLPSHNTDVTLEENELLNIEWSYKYSYDEALQLFKEADLRLVNSWKAPDSEYRLWLLERPLVSFSGPAESPITTEKEKASIVMPKNVPKWAQWLDLWKLWDHITLDMIPEEALHQKPIDLRHICLFYLGHIPTFLDIHLTRMTNGAHTEPEKFKDIFERGIDPDVDDPTKIHSHSEVPAQEEDWPTLAEILSFRDRVRARLRGIYDQLESGQLEFSRHIGRVLFMTFEHEAMHAETLLYMLQQSPLTRAPTAVAQPQWASLAKRWARESTPNKVLTIEGGAIELGHDDLEADDAKFTNGDWADHEFGWDNEHPRITTQVKRFQVDSLPISNQDYLEFVNHKGIGLANAPQESLPASWVKVDGEWRVRSLYGPVSFDVAGGWPLMASRNEIKDFAASKGGRLPTEPELRMLWKSDDGPRPAGKLANIGFENWHPIPPAHTQTDNAGRVLHGHNGGVWEWTDSVFEPYEGYVPSEIYPGYSADFFDQKHYVVLGGSYATVPTLAGRESVRNWYQSNYRFSFIGGRVVYDL